MHGVLLTAARVVTAPAFAADGWTATQRVSGPNGGAYSQTGIDARGKAIVTWVAYRTCAGNCTYVDITASVHQP